MHPAQEINHGEEEYDGEVTKDRFKSLYFKYATPDSGYTEDYWNHFFENQEGERYFFRRSANPAAVMCISTGQKENRIYFLTEESLDAFYDFPGKDES